MLLFQIEFFSVSDNGFTHNLQFWLLVQANATRQCPDRHGPRTPEPVCLLFQLLSLAYYSAKIIPSTFPELRPGVIRFLPQQLLQANTWQMETQNKQQGKNFKNCKL